MGFGSRVSLAAVLGFAAAFAVACGSGGNGLLSSADSSSISAQLDSISSSVDAGHCIRAAAASRRLTNVIADLPSGVDQKLLANLGQGASTVSELAANQCQPKTTSTPTVTSSTTTTPPATTTSAPTSTATQTTPPATTTSGGQTTTSTPPPNTATNGGGAGTSTSGSAGGGAPVG